MNSPVLGTFMSRKDFLFHFNPSFISFEFIENKLHFLNLMHNENFLVVSNSIESFRFLKTPFSGVSTTIYKIELFRISTYFLSVQMIWHVQVNNNK